MPKIHPNDTQTPRNDTRAAMRDGRLEVLTGSSLELASVIN
jgi:hypothetical protein